MLLSFSIENFEVYNSEVKLSMEADLRIKKLMSNVILDMQGNALKSVAIYGPNNTGKTCIMDAIRAYRSVLMNKPLHYQSNLFSTSPVIKLGATFLFQGAKFEYAFCYDTENNFFCQEEFIKIIVDQYGNETRQIYFQRDTVTKQTKSFDKELEGIINLSSKDNILIYSIDTADFPILQEAKLVMRSFAEKIVIISMESLSPLKTIEILKQSNRIEAKQIVTLIKSADLDIDDFTYDDNVEIAIDGEDERLKNVLNTSDKFMDQMRLMSVHRGEKVPSIAFDSHGTKKIIAIASYLVDVLNNGKILFLDEMDSGIHFKLSRAIISLFNSSLNNSAQLVCTTHDSSLLDIKTLFRKEQLWFTDKDDKQTYLYSLADFTAENSGIRPETDLYERYNKGLLGALPDPSLIEFLILKKDGAYDE